MFALILVNQLVTIYEFPSPQGPLRETLRCDLSDINESVLITSVPAGSLEDLS